MKAPFTIQRRIWVTFQRHGIHQYKEAPPVVGYLASPHRHLFKFKVTVDVNYSNREVEFHMLQNWLDSRYSDSVLQLDNKSCETIAEDLIKEISERYTQFNFIEVEVSEDGECGAIVTQKVKQS